MFSNFKQKFKRKGFLIKSLYSSIMILILLLNSCNQLTTPPVIDEETPPDTTLEITGPNGSVNISEMTNNSLTVNYEPESGSSVESASLFLSVGDGLGLVLASQLMDNTDGIWSYTFSHDSYISGSTIHIDVLAIDSGAEVNVPQGQLADVSTWASFVYNESTSGNRVTFDSQNATTEASPSSITVVEPDTTIDTLPTPPTRAGYIFKGWFTQTLGNGDIFDETYEVLSDITVYAFWEKSGNVGEEIEVTGVNGTVYISNMADTSLTVSYTPDSQINAAKLFLSEGNGMGLVIASQDMNNDSGTYTYTFSHPTFTNSAKIYINILQNQDGIETNIPQGELSDTSSWAYFNYGEAAEEYIITFDSQDADVAASPSTVTVTTPQNTLGSFPDNPEKDGFVFGGWYTLPNGMGTLFKTSTVISSDLTLYAQWLIATTYTITFDDMGATTPVDPTTVEAIGGLTIPSMPSQPSKTDYNFIGWNSSSDGTGNWFSSNTVVTGDTTVYAVWQIKKNDEYNWQLVWSDEFNDGIFDESKWTREEMAPETVNFEWQEYVSSESNSWEENGNMVIKLSYDGPTRDIGNYSSARINSANKFEFTYGKISARIRVDYMEQGVWPAFWLLGSSCDEYGGDVPWPECGEVDILEIIGGTDETSGKDREKEAWSTMHWCTPPGPDLSNEHVGRKYENGMLVLDEKIWGDEYHIYEVIWDEQYISASIDGNVYFTANIEDVDKSEFHEDFFIIFNIACGGNWPGDPTLEQDVNMYIDWVRVYQEDPTEDYVRDPIALRNGTFDTSAEYWQPIGFNWEFGWPAGWDMTRASYDIVNSEYVCDLIYAAESWNPKIRQTALTYFDQHEYTLRFDARSIGSSRTIFVEAGPTERDLGSEEMYLNESVTLSTTMQSFEYTFTATDTIYNGGLFFLVGEQNVDVVFDNIEIIDNTDPSAYY